MAILPQAFLFNWQHIDAASDLDRLRLVLGAIDDEPLMQVLEKERGRGRDEYPVRVVWNTVLAGVVFQHSSVASLRRELLRNAELRQTCGCDPQGEQDSVPTDSAFSNFLESVMEHRGEIRDMFDTLVEKLRQELDALGRYLAVDGKALPSFGKPEKKAPKTASAPDKPACPTPATAAAGGDKPAGLKTATADEEQDRRREQDADWGVKTCRGKRPDGTAWEKVVTWFGFELHLVVDSLHELPLHYKVTQASASETVELLPLVDATKDKHPEIIAKTEELAADKGYDSAENNQRLYDEYGIRPIIDKRSDWKDRTDATRPLFADSCDTVVYDVKGTISCICPVTGEPAWAGQMAYWGFEKDRGTLKYSAGFQRNGG